MDTSRTVNIIVKRFKGGLGKDKSSETWTKAISVWAYLAPGMGVRVQGKNFDYDFGLSSGSRLVVTQLGNYELLEAFPDHQMTDVALESLGFTKAEA